MNRSRILMYAAAFVAFLPAYGQQPASPAKPHQLKKRYIVRRPADAQTLTHESLLGQAAAGATIPFWAYNIVSPVDGKTYTGTMVGRNPGFHGHRPTYITTYIIPIVFTFAVDGGVYDPTVTDSCLNNSVLNMTLASPMFQNVSYTMSGVQVGTTEYVDAFQRANFWQDVKGTPWFTYLRPTVLPSVKVTVPADKGSSNFSISDCGDFTQFGLMDIDWWDTYLQTTLMPGLASKGVSPTSFPIFLFNSVFEYQGDQSQCCILGYHSAYTNSSNTLQTYSISSWDTSGQFGGDISVSSHEIAEWMDDPAVNNATPAWGNIGQVTGCQANLEVGDPLTGTDWGTVTMNSNHYTYTVQELAFFSWFFHQSPSLGAAGFYSNNKTFTAPPSGVCQ
jgi:hypothetical protein